MSNPYTCQYQTRLRASVQRVQCGILTVAVFWAGAQSSFRCSLKLTRLGKLDVYP
ncbi:MAG: hypothetical protein ABI977_33970 [Acidobacteriota bacterium]